MPNVEISVVVPLFDEEENLPALHGEIDRALASTGRSWELVYVNDGSGDASLEVLRGLADGPCSGQVRVLHFERNSGQSAALRAGFQAARGELIATLDADLQNDPADIPLLLDALKDHDGVSGVRVQRQDTWVRRVASRVANRVRAAVVHDSITDVGCSLKVYRAPFVKDLPFFDGMHRFLPALAQMRGARFTEVPVHHRPRIHGQSKYGIGGRLRRGIVDLCGVRWLQRRWVDHRLVQEVKVWTPKRSGSVLDSPDRDSSSHGSSSSGSPRSDRSGA